MFKKDGIYKKIVKYLKVLSCEIEEKAKNNHTDDNVWSEDFIKDILNVCQGWNLKSLNIKNKKFPGIDLGDKDRRIGVQVTSTKTSDKISKSLDMISSNGIYKKYSKIYFFILVKKQKNYKINFDKYDTIEFSKDHIWDINDVIKWCSNYNSEQMQQVWEIIERELVINNKEYSVPTDVKKCILEFKNTIHKIFEISQKIKLQYNTSEKCISIDEYKKSIDRLEILLPYIDDNIYNTCKNILEDSLKLSEEVKDYRKNIFNIDETCRNITRKELIEKSLLEVSELFKEDITGVEKGIEVIIDGNDLINRLVSLKIDCDILYKQFSVEKFIEVMKDCIFREIRKCIILFSEEEKYTNKDMIDRFESEGTEVEICKNRLEITEFVSEKIKSSFEIGLVSLNENTMRVLEKKDDCYIYTASFENNLLPSKKSMFFLEGSISLIELNRCFNYNENKKYNMKDITEDDYRNMISNANDCFAHQLRVDQSGEVYISTITGGEELKYVKLREESWDAGNEYVGPRAASNREYIKESLETLKKEWENAEMEYYDYE